MYDLNIGFIRDCYLDELDRSEMSFTFQRGTWYAVVGHESVQFREAYKKPIFHHSYEPRHDQRDLKRDTYLLPD